MRRTPRAASPTRAASASRRPCRTLPMAVRSTKTSCSRPRRLPLQEGSLLFERVRAHCEAAGRTHPDRRLNLVVAVPVVASVAIVAVAIVIIVDEIADGRAHGGTRGR